jgi:signal transduction histidine kinase/putative methionine-R-sulfoxide reductase with GAF domain
MSERLLLLEAPASRAAPEFPHSPAPVERLLAAVVSATRSLVEHDDLYRGLAHAVEHLGQASGHDRAYVFEMLEQGRDIALVAEWTAPGIADVATVWGASRFAARDFADVLEPLRRGLHYRSLPADRADANLALNVAVGTVSDLMVPVQVDGALWGIVGLDNCREDHDYQSAEIDALRGASEAIAAAVQRCRARAAHAASEALRLAQAEADNRLLRSREALLEAVGEATRHLVAEPTLDAAVAAALDALRRGTGVDRVYVLRYASDTQATSFWIESRLPGVPAFVEGFGPGPLPDADFPEVALPLREGRTYRSLAHERSGLNATANAINGSVSDLIVPIMVDGRYRGCIGFDDNSSPRDWSDGEVAVLNSAANAIAAAIGRDDAERAARDAERRRTVLAQTIRELLEAVVEASRLLHECENFDEAVEAWFGTIAQAAGADAAYFGDFSASGQPGIKAGWRSPERQFGKLAAIAEAIPMSSDFRRWVDALMAGRVVWGTIDDLEDPISRAYWRRIDRAAVVIAPLRAGQQTFGWIAFDSGQPTDWDDTQVTVLSTAAGVLSAALKREEARLNAAAEREGRLAAERARADAAARMAGMLGDLARSSRALIDAGPQAFESALRRWLGELAAHTHAQRATFYDSVPFQETGVRTARMLCEWVREGVDGSVPVSFDAPYVIDPRGCESLMAQMLGGAVVAIHTEETTSPMREFLAAQGNATVLCVPVLMGGVPSFFLSFDFAQRHDVDAAEAWALSTAAETLAAVLRRNEAASALLAEREARLDVERQRTQELRLANEAIAQAVSGLARGSDLESFLDDLLRAAIDASDARSGTVTLLENDVARQIVRRLPSADGPGTERVSPSPERIAIDFARVDAQVGSRDPGELLFFPSDAPWIPEAHRECHRRIGNRLVGLVPLIAAGHMIGWMGLGFAGAQAPPRRVTGLLRVLADQMTVALELGRLAAQAQEAAVIAERERTEHARLLELSRVNEALRASLDALAETADADAFLRHSLHQIAGHAGAQAVWLYRTTSDGARLRLVGCSREGRFSVEGSSDDPELVPAAPVSDARVGSSQRAGRLRWLSLVEPFGPDPELAQVAAWHRRVGHRASGVQALMIGPRQVGLVAMAFDHDRRLGQTREELIHALCQPLALALELLRLGRESRRSAERAAVLDERNRLAREIHDSIAQSFLAIQMQLGSIESEPAPAPVTQALALARHGLTEARRAVSALRPTLLVDRGLPDAVAAALGHWTAGAGLQVQVDQPGRWQALPVDVEDHLFRLVQESVHNVVKHAQARRLHIEISQGLDTTSVLVTDDGVGFDHGRASEGFGLEGMQQRARLIGAQLQWHSERGSGTQVLISLPSPRELVGDGDR